MSAQQTIDVTDKDQVAYAGSKGSNLIWFANLNDTPGRTSLWLDHIGNVVDRHRDCYSGGIDIWGTDDTAAVMKKMKETPVNDFFAKNGRIREDGRHVHDFYLLQVKKPDESKNPWDYYHVRATIPAADERTVLRAEALVSHFHPAAVMPFGVAVRLLDHGAPQPAQRFREPELLKWLVGAVQSAAEVPCCIDSPDPKAIADGPRRSGATPALPSCSAAIRIRRFFTTR